MRHTQPTLVLMLATVLALGAVENKDDKPVVIPLGPIGGEAVLVPGEGHVRIQELMPKAPGVQAGLLPGDLIAGAFGTAFGPTSKSSHDGYRGAVQDLGLAVERAESEDGRLPLTIIRPGKGQTQAVVTLPRLGGLGGAYPLGSAKFAVFYEQACKRIHERALASSGKQGFNTGWFGLALLGHPQWSSTYRRGIDMIRDAVVAAMTAPTDKGGFCYAPVEDVLLDGTTKNPNHAANSGGPGNWDLGAHTMFLAEYRRRTGDKTVDAALQRAVEICANRIQWWKQPPLNGHRYSPGFEQIAGIISHGGVTGDYIHGGWGGGINMTGVHIFSGMALARQAGVKMDVRPRDGHYFGFPEAPEGAVPKGLEKKDFSLDEKFAMEWAWLARTTTRRGNTGYTTEGSTGDAAGRTAGALFGFLASGRTLDAADLKRTATMKEYLVEHFHRLQHAHAYTHGGQCFYQLVLPFLDERHQRHIMDNWRFFFALSRNPDGSLAYFGGRENNGGDGYLGFDKVIDTIWALTGSVGIGELPCHKAIPRDPDRVYASFRKPFLTWPTMPVRIGRVTSYTQDFQVDIIDAQGRVVDPSAYSATWSAAATAISLRFSQPRKASTTITFPPGKATYHLQLTVVHKGCTIKEPIDIEVDVQANAKDSLASEPAAGTPAVPAAAPPTITTQPQDAGVSPGGTARFTVAVQGRGPFTHQWRLDGTPLRLERPGATVTIDNVGGGLAGRYDCVITGADGAVTSTAATLTVAEAGLIRPGGLWCDRYTTARAGFTRLDDLLKDPQALRWSDAGLAVPLAEAPAPPEGTGFQRLSGWFTVPRSGDWQFILAGTTSAMLRISEDERPSRSRMVAMLTMSTAPRQWSLGTPSALLPFRQGGWYFIDCLHQIRNGRSGIAIAWRRAGEPMPADGSDAIPANALIHRTGGVVTDLAQPLSTLLGTGTAPAGGERS